MRVRIAPGIGAVEHDGRVYVASLPEGPIYVLVDAAAAVWRAAASDSPVDDNEYVRALAAAALLTITEDT